MPMVLGFTVLKLEDQRNAAGGGAGATAGQSMGLLLAITRAS